MIDINDFLREYLQPGFHGQMGWSGFSFFKTATNNYYGKLILRLLLSSDSSFIRSTGYMGLI